MNIFKFRLVIVTIILFLGFNISVIANQDEAWSALHQLQIEKAKTLFQEELKKSPDDLSLMRGLLLASYFDMDHATQTKMIESLIKADPSNPYLLAIYEHISANMDGWSDYSVNRLKIGRALAEHSDDKIRYIGQQMIEAYLTESMDSSVANEIDDLNFPIGAWVSGPFENESSIAAYRKLPFESEPLDTNAHIFGKVGTKAGWTWVPSVMNNIISINMAMENEAEVAAQMRLFFELPKKMDVVIICSGGYRGRILLDGAEIYNDPQYRNSFIRQGLMVNLPQGKHELTIILCDNGGGIAPIPLVITDTNYRAIDGLQWLRFAKIKYRDDIEVRQVNPIFDSFEKHIEKYGSSPDTRYWKAMLDNYNGYHQELINELETANNNNEISPLEKCMLYKALKLNGENLKALEYLKQIRDVSSSAFIDFAWLTESGSDYPSIINGCGEMERIYPDRVEIMTLSCMSPLLNGNIQQFVDSLNAVVALFPGFVAHYNILSDLYYKSIGNYDLALEYFIKSCDSTNSRNALINGLPNYYYALKKYDLAIEAAKNQIKHFDFSYNIFRNLVNAYRYANHEDSALALLDSLKKVYPYNIAILSDMYDLYYITGKYDQANGILNSIHKLRPTAVKPYQILDSLHNNFTYDTIFGKVDPLELWDYEPTVEELAESNYWYLLDRRQKLIFEHGVILSDIHTVMVLTNQDAVEANQEISLGFDPSAWYNNLLTVRRLRKNQPPLKGSINGNKVVFQDLQVGDAIETHYRIWSGNSGDLWNDYWETYAVHVDYYQHNYEYTILSNRSDLNYQSIGPVPTPVEDEHCGFKRISWKEENVAAYNLSYSMAPPFDDFIGKIYISTIDDWNILGNWYRSISDAVLGKNPRADRLADSLTVGSKSDLEKLKAIYSYIVLEIPYQVIGFDYDGSIPHSPDNVLLNRWGDCKDKGHLLVHMLTRVGVEAWPILTSTRDNGTTIPLPHFLFDHLIIGCLIDGDTVYVDASDMTYPVERTISYASAGQPLLHIKKGHTDRLDRLPPYLSENYRMFTRIKIDFDADGYGRFIDYRDYDNQSAGNRRYDYLAMTKEEMKSDFMAYYSDLWKAELTLDSTVNDSSTTIDSLFREIYYGQIKLNKQKVGNSTIITPPIETILSRSLLTYLGDSIQRIYDIDLRTFVGVYRNSLELIVPLELGEPEIIEDAVISDSLYNFSFSNSWEADKRKLTLDYSMEIHDGVCSLEEFSDFIKQALDLCDISILLQK